MDGLTDGDLEALTLGLMLTDGLTDADLEGLMLTDGLTEAEMEGEILGLFDGLMLTEGETDDEEDGETETEGLTDGDLDADIDGETLADTEAIWTPTFANKSIIRSNRFITSSFQDMRTYYQTQNNLCNIIVQFYSISP